MPPPLKKFKVPGKTAPQSPSTSTAAATAPSSASDEVPPWEEAPAIDWSKGDSEESIQEAFERATPSAEAEQEEVLGHSVGSPDLIKKALYYVRAASREGGQHPLFDDIEVCLGTAADKMQAYINEMEVR